MHADNTDVFQSILLSENVLFTSRDVKLLFSDQGKIYNKVKSMIKKSKCNLNILIKIVNMCQDQNKAVFKNSCCPSLPLANG